MKKTTRTIQNKRPRLAFIVLLLIAAIALFLLKNSIFDNKKIGSDTAGNGSSIDQAPLITPKQSAPPAANSTETTDKVTPPPTPPLPPLSSTPCQQVAEDLGLFFKQLELQDYIKAYAFNKPIQDVLNDIITKLLNTPPINANERVDILTVLKNSAHLYRTLGSKDLSLLKAILTHEEQNIEQHLASLYAWSTMEKECRDKSAIKIQLPLAKTYEYAAFFLNTLGGHSYLLRRDATLRVLTRYYCILILNEAVKHSINKYDINLPYHLEAVTKEIGSSDFLENQSLYLETLGKIKVGQVTPLKGPSSVPARRGVQNKALR